MPLLGKTLVVSGTLGVPVPCNHWVTSPPTSFKRDSATTKVDGMTSTALRRVYTNDALREMSVNEGVMMHTRKCLREPWRERIYSVVRSIMGRKCQWTRYSRK